MLSGSVEMTMPRDALHLGFEYRPCDARLWAMESARPAVTQGLSVDQTPQQVLGTDS